MASSRKSNRSRPAAPDLAARVAERIGDFLKPSVRLVVGLSGGADSVVLLDCLHRLSRKLRFRLAALHVDHQLSPNASRWAAFCRRLCHGRGIAFKCVKVVVPRGAQMEVSARTARYEAFAQQDCDCVVLAHHRDDQVETLLLQLLRGAGVKGLAGMPVLRKAKGEEGKAESSSPVTRHASPGILRPLLDTTREEILAYAGARGLNWIEDESNLDTRLRRNFLRHEILPAIERRFPSYRVTVARAAEHLAEASRLLDEAAADDARDGIAGDSLALSALRRLSPARARNVLRWFLAGRGVIAPSTARLAEALRQSLSAKPDARISIELEGARLMRHRDRLHVVAGTRPARPIAMGWRGESRLELPEGGGVLTFTRARGRGIAVARLRGAAVTIRSRAGGERLRPNSESPTRSLKNLLQESGVPPWLRERIPLLYSGDALVWVPGIGTDCAFQARGNEPGWVVKWTTRN